MNILLLVELIFNCIINTNIRIQEISKLCLDKDLTRSLLFVTIQQWSLPKKI